MPSLKVRYFGDQNYPYPEYEKKQFNLNVKVLSFYQITLTWIFEGRIRAYYKIYIMMKQKPMKLIVNWFQKWEHDEDAFTSLNHLWWLEVENWLLSRYIITGDMFTCSYLIWG